MKKLILISQKNKQNKKQKKSQKKFHEKKEPECLEDNDIIPDAIILNPGSVLTTQKITKMMKEEEKIDSNKESQKEECKIAKYFSQTKWI